MVLDLWIVFFFTLEGNYTEILKFFLISTFPCNYNTTCRTSSKNCRKLSAWVGKIKKLAKSVAELQQSVSTYVKATWRFTLHTETSCPRPDAQWASCFPFSLLPVKEESLWQYVHIHTYRAHARSKLRWIVGSGYYSLLI